MQVQVVHCSVWALVILQKLVCAFILGYGFSLQLKKRWWNCLGWDENKKQVNILQRLHLIRSCLLCANVRIIPLPSYSKCSYQYSLDLAIILLHPESLHWLSCFIADCRILLSSSECLIDNLNFSHHLKSPVFGGFLQMENSTLSEVLSQLNHLLSCLAEKCTSHRMLQQEN